MLVIDGVRDSMERVVDSSVAVQDDLRRRKASQSFFSK
jgi:hypothetical protein